MDTKINTKKNRKCISMKFIVCLAYIISVISNIILAMILYLTNHMFKWGGYAIHGVLLFSCIASLKYVIYMSGKSIRFYCSSTKLFTYSVISSSFFYISITIYMYIYKIDREIIHFYCFCVIIWTSFHYILISIINSYIQALIDRPELSSGKSAPEVDKDLQEMMLNDIKK